MALEKQNGAERNTAAYQEIEKKLRPYLMTLRLLSVFKAAAAIAVAAACISALIHGTTLGTAGILGGGMGLLFFALLFSKKVKKDYDTAFRREMGDELEQLIASYLGCGAEGDSAEVKNRIEQAIREGGLYDDFDACCVDSYRRGNHNGLSFEAFNAVLTKQTEEKGIDSDGGTVINREKKTVFDGMWIFAPLGRAIPSPVIICAEGIQTQRDEAYWNLQAQSPTTQKTFYVHTEDIQFAQSLLTSQFIQWLETLAEDAGAKCTFCLTGKHLYMAMQGGKHFLDMEGTVTGHIADLKANLEDSLQKTCRLLEHLTENGDLFASDETVK